MQVTVIGCGKIGRELAIKLIDLGEEVVVIDREVEHLEDLKDYDVVLINGRGIDLAVLKKAGLETADVVLCVSDNENANIMAGQIARHIFNVPQVIVRTNFADNSPIYEQLGLTPVCTTQLTVERIIETIGAYEADVRIDFFGNPVEFYTIDADPEWLGHRLLSLEDILDAKPFALLRNGALMMSSLDIRITEGDKLIFCKLAVDGEAKE
ncbi:MAG TPA: NAD(P)-binding domain-containing protein [Clostridiaceae bacterium]|nr:NAD(P)-binding domain-containing protein [Clostridiaceae bacterium]